MKSETDYTGLLETWKKDLEIPGKPNEWEVKELMRGAGLPVPENVLLKAGEPLPDGPVPGVEAPYAVKLCSAEVLHKTDVGGVVLGVTAEELTGVLSDLRERFPGEHLLLSSMVPVRGPEFILGALSDPVFGPAVMAGAGGILAELYKDVAFRLAPCTPAEAGRMLTELTIAPVLTGFRGSSMDLEGLKTIIARFSLLAGAATAEGAQLDINPLVWTGSQWLVLDGKAVL
ncbi:MAG: acetate--CoA ligase family protein [Spirochaetales bacterium]|nr:acetate--CoA ligase family protein [Spirochaetales bacterium]